MVDIVPPPTNSHPREVSLEYWATPLPAVPVRLRVLVDRAVVAFSTPGSGLPAYAGRGHEFRVTPPIAGGHEASLRSLLADRFPAPSQYGEGNSYLEQSRERVLRRGMECQGFYQALCEQLIVLQGPWTQLPGDACRAVVRSTIPSMPSAPCGQFRLLQASRPAT